MEKVRSVITLMMQVFLFGAGGILIGFLLLVGVYMLPTGRMKSHIAESERLFNYEGDYPQLMNGISSSQLDNFTDALMCATAIHSGSGNVLYDAVYNARYMYEDSSNTQSLIDYAKDVSAEESMRIELGYSRYWHGYLVVLKPILFFLNVSEIRMFNMFMQTVLLALLIYMIHKKLGVSYTIPVLMMVFVLNPVTLPLSLQFSWVYYASLFGAIILLGMNYPPTNKCYLFLFMAIGMLTSYIDLLTYPLITLGLPLVLFVLKSKELNLGKRIMMTILLSVFWFGGYAGMWAGKWGIAYFVGHINLLKEISFSILYRTSMKAITGEAVTLWMVIKAPLSVILNKINLLMMISFIAGCLFWTMYKRQINGRNPRIGLKESLLYILPYVYIAVMPFAWYCVLSNHTHIHYWFAYREIAVTVLAIGTAVLDYLNKQRR